MTDNQLSYFSATPMISWFLFIQLGHSFYGHLDFLHSHTMLIEMDVHLVWSAHGTDFW